MEFSEYLEYLGWSQAELARRIGVTPDTVSRWRGSPPQVVMMYLECLRSQEDYGSRFTIRHEVFIARLEEVLKEGW